MLCRWRLEARQLQGSRDSESLGEGGGRAKGPRRTRTRQDKQANRRDKHGHSACGTVSSEARVSGNEPNRAESVLYAPLFLFPRGPAAGREQRVSACMASLSLDSVKRHDLRKKQEQRKRGGFAGEAVPAAASEQFSSTSFCNLEVIPVSSVGTCYLRSRYASCSWALHMSVPVRGALEEENLRRESANGRSFH